ncbi:hypothetical protein QE152_g15511 [Popillia japonica]|uniref:Transposase n=1 Tax=Popillia japonica TaxID=7064 RepID=A0AAW1L7W1_POPJA
MAPARSKQQGVTCLKCSVTVKRVSCALRVGVLFVDETGLAYKRGDKEKEENYRHILPAFSKVFETAICRRIVSFWEKNKIFTPVQHGYISGKSTITALG